MLASRFPRSLVTGGRELAGLLSLDGGGGGRLTPAVDEGGATGPPTKGYHSHNDHTIARHMPLPIGGGGGGGGGAPPFGGGGPGREDGGRGGAPRSLGGGGGRPRPPWLRPGA